MFYGVPGQPCRSTAKDDFGVTSLLVPLEQPLTKEAKSGAADKLLPVTLHTCENSRGLQRQRPLSGRHVGVIDPHDTSQFIAPLPVQQHLCAKRQRIPHEFQAASDTGHRGQLCGPTQHMTATQWQTLPEVMKPTIQLQQAALKRDEGGILVEISGHAGQVNDMRRVAGVTLTVEMQCSGNSHRRRTRPHQLAHSHIGPLCSCAKTCFSGRSIDDGLHQSQSGTR
ncbi:hypothetical protein CER19_18945 [Pseudomonas sp. GL93]|nr:hypothetical protein CER19_18945 [Pseudomonas sp. GL93]